MYRFLITANTTLHSSCYILLCMGGVSLKMFSGTLKSSVFTLKSKHTLHQQTCYSTCLLVHMICFPACIPAEENVILMHLRGEHLQLDSWINGNETLLKIFWNYFVWVQLLSNFKSIFCILPTNFNTYFDLTGLFIRKHFNRLLLKKGDESKLHSDTTGKFKTKKMEMACTYCFALFTCPFPLMILCIYSVTELFTWQTIFKKSLGDKKHKVPVVLKYTGPFWIFLL
jgi:hypothetical protein